MIDSHHHFWDPEELDLPPVPPECAVLNQAFLPSGLLPELEKSGIRHSVLVQGYPQSDAGNRWLLSVAEQAPFVAGTVAWGSLTDPDHFVEQLDELVESPKFCGIRHIVEDESDDRFLLRDTVITSLAELAARSIPFDILVKPRHLPFVVQLLDKVPALSAVIDHLGKPDIAGGDTRLWRECMPVVAEHPAIHCKFSGMVTEANWHSAVTDDFRECADRVLEWFGVDRLMYGSDWPVCLLAADYARVWNLANELLSHVSETDYTKIFGGNAARFYSLKLDQAVC